MKTITERLKALISRTLLPENKFKALEQLTGISGGTWRTWWNRNSKPSAEMIEAVAKQWPECAFWLVTGIDDADHGHISEDMMALLGNKDRPVRRLQREQAASLFKTLIEMNNYEEASMVPPKLVERERYLRRIREAEEKMLSELEQRQQGPATA